MNNPKVSVVIPVYNTEAYVEQTLRSIMGQTLRDIELIVINDGSTDGSLSALERIATGDRRIRLYTQPNKGLSETRNAGIDRARGEFIYFMDSDDLLEPDALERCYERCQSDRLDFVFFDAESFGAAASDAAWFDYRRAKYFGTEVCDGTALLRRMLALHCYRASACLSFIRTAYLRGLGLRFYPGILHEDELFTPQLYLGASRAGGIERSFFKRRIHGDSIMGRGFSRRNLEGYTTVLRELNRFAAQRDAGQRQLIRTLTRQILRPVMCNAWALPAGARWKLAWDALRHYPGSIDGRALATLLFKKPLKKRKREMSVRRELASGVFYTSIAKYAGIVVTLVVTGILSRLFTPEQFGVVNIATVVIAFFAIFSDLGIGPAVIQHKNLDRHDLGGIFSLSVWSGAVMALLFFAAAGTIASLYGDSQVLRNVLRILALNLFFAAANIVPNALILKEKRFRFAAMRSLTVQIAGGTAAIAAAYAGAGIYALTINPVFSSLMLLAINYRQNPLPLRLRPGRKALGKVFSFSAYQFSFQLINYFSRNLDKLLMGRYMSLSQLGYYDKSYRLMMLPLQNIAYVISPVMHPIFSEMQHDLKQLGASYLKVVRLLAFIGLPLSAVLFFTAQELVLIIFGDQWEPSVPVFRILALSVGIQIVMSTSGSIFQAANATRMLFFCGVFSAALNVAAICTGIFAFGTTEAVAWCICASFAVNFVQCYHALFCLTLRTGWHRFWRNFLSPLLLTALVGLPLAAVGWLLPPMPLVASLTLKGTAALGVWLLYVHLSGEYDLKGLAGRLLARKKR